MTLLKISHLGTR